MSHVARLKLFATVSFFFVFVLASSETVAEISYYGISTVLYSDGRSDIELVITFSKPLNSFNFDIIGRVENLNASSIAGPIECLANVKGISSISCKMNLTQERRTIQISFQTSDFVKSLENKFFFSADFSLNENVERVLTSVKLPEGTALVENGIPGRLTYSKNATTASDGRRIIVTWQLSNITVENPLKFEILYESLITPLWAQMRIRYVVIFAIVTAAILALIILRRAKKSEQLVLSVLDDFERKVMDIIVASQGEVNQKKVVQDTNLSKAKVSRIVKSLVERGLIEVERRGRTNKLRLIKKKFKL